MYFESTFALFLEEIVNDRSTFEESVMEMTRRQILLLVSLAALAVQVGTKNGVAAQGSVSQAIRDACQNTLRPDVCIFILSSDPRSRDRKYPGQLAYLATLLSNEKGKESLNHISDLQKQTTDPYLKKVLNYCHDRYELGPVGHTSTALEHLNDGDHNLAAQSLSDCVAKVDECDHIFRIPPYPPSVLAETDEVMNKYCYVALELVNSLGN
ncbi:hypothetical protein H6P81_018845 [Aristolochia fimbriata]|uniref:Pectinesterase inhibitor domain-containing protein n=1 Tax=Aristolochia fimbriata TaxID=158543 RepID=A0AAV7E556_ARIFI|nr:hypothetical protein H6P81_018845 [Aristolochia fimbriata]